MVAISIMVHKALAVADRLAREGIELEVIDPRTLVPMDWETIYKSVRKTGRVVIMDEGCFTGGVAAEIAARVGRECFDYLDAPIRAGLRHRHAYSVQSADGRVCDSARG